MMYPLENCVPRWPRSPGHRFLERRGGGGEGAFMFVSDALSSSPIDVVSSASMATLLFFDSCTFFFFSSKTVVTMSPLVKNEEKSKNVFLLTKITVRGGLALFNDH